MKHKIQIKLIAVSLIILFSIAAPNLKDLETPEGKNIEEVNFYTAPESSQILGENITGFQDTIERVLGVMEIKVDLTGSTIPTKEVNLTIGYSNGASLNYTMTNNTSPDLWEYDFTPLANASLGASMLNVTFHDGSVFQHSSNEVFQIENSVPSIGIMISDAEVYRNNSIYFNITPSDAEDSISELTWNSTIIRASTDLALLGTTTNSELEREHLFSSSFDDSFLGMYYIEAVVKDSDGNSSVNRIYFSVLNNNPEIIWSDIQFSDTETTDPGLNEILRVSGTMEIKINVSDVDKSNLEAAINGGEIELRIWAEGKDTYVFSNIIATIGDAGENSDFKCNVTVPAFISKGDYKLFISVFEKINSVDYNSTVEYDFTIVNNLPDASLIEYSINDLTPGETSLLRFQEFDDLDFKINVTGCDPEGIELIRLSLINEENKWFNFTFQNNNVTNIVEFTMRARDLAPGQWYVYIYITDGDGEEISSGAGANIFSFDIVGDEFSVFLPYLMLIFGMILGLGIGVLLVGIKYVSMKRNYETSLSEQLSTPITKQKQQKKKSVKQPVKETKNEETEDVEEETDAEPVSKSKKKRKMTRKIKK